MGAQLVGALEVDLDLADSRPPGFLLVVFSLVELVGLFQRCSRSLLGCGKRVGFGVVGVWWMSKGFGVKSGVGVWWGCWMLGRVGFRKGGS